ncbi:MAG: hypothetical protein COU31_04780 [Candidatus Magasanikbacteria bacterium CG10_big_fil_rev_8_21_14_0_10_40_10]|uniref:Uncharacterized protein n=1 Tax=Candidatus Magasanikbacteria bacterium CG10_big_fil_rev_8_21_14_0_10_40_10 TaxID=1974648 RepID=A0A2M6W2W4_9BACT|nr:MAG: hypothetical protein COU31_04780 [Candidatus Magasanikbacteria bacterium CG10_big_fil_rev_8_21_14_0_10_40_10]
MKNIAKKIHLHLQSAGPIVVAVHQNPDGDALGSAFAFASYLRLIGRPTILFCATGLPANLEFIHGKLDFVHDPTQAITPDTHTIVVLDSGDLRYAGLRGHLNNHPAVIINIDHHPTNEAYGHFNLTDHTASSTAEIVFNFLNYNNIKLTASMATALLTGLITDTNNLTNSATSISAINTASQLIRLGGNLSTVNKWTVKNSSMAMLKIWGVILQRLEFIPDKEIAYTYLTRQDCQTAGLLEHQTEGVANFMNNISGVKASLFLKEVDNNQVKGSFRTTIDNVDVSAWAKKMGGGGHKKAAGFTATGSIEQVLDKILAM